MITSLEMRRWRRQEYLRQHAEQRRATAKAAGAKRIDVTLQGAMLDDYATVRRYIQGLNRLIADRKVPALPIRLSDTEIIKMALNHAAASIRENDEQARRDGLIRMLD